MTLDQLTAVPDERPLLATPRGVVGLLDTVVRVRGEVTRAVERGITMSDLAATMSGQNRAMTITAHESDGSSWTISLGAAEAAESARS